MTRVFGLVCVALLSIPGCARNPAPARGDQKTSVHERQSTMKRDPTQSEPAHVLLEVRSGPQLGFGDDEFSARTSIDLATGTGTYVVNRHHHEQALAIGEFSGALDPTCVGGLRSAIGTIDWSFVPVSAHGGPGTSVMNLEVRDGTKLYREAFSSRDLEVLEYLDPLVQATTICEDQLLQQPFVAISVQAVPRSRGEHMEFEWTLSNAGSQTAVVSHPTRLGGDSNSSWAGVKVAPVRGDAAGHVGHTLEWTFVSLRQGGEDLVEDLELPASQGATFLTDKWTPQAGQTYVFAAVYASYAGDAVKTPGSRRIRGNVHGPRQLGVLRP